MSFGRLLRTLWHRRVVFALVAASVLLSGYSYLAGRPKVYRATASVALLPDPDPTLAAYYAQSLNALVLVYDEMVRSTSFQKQVAARMKQETGDAPPGAIFPESAPDVAVVFLHCVAADPVTAAHAVTAAAHVLVDDVSTVKLAQVRPLDEGDPHSGPVAPNTKLALIASVLLALFAGAAAAVGWERAFGRIRDVAGLAEAAGVAVIGAIPKERSLRKRPRVAAGDLALSDFQDAVRSLGTNLVFEMERSGARSLALVSLEAGAGRSVLAANLAVAVGELGFDVLVVDADNQQAGQHRLFGLANEPGLAGVAAGAVSLPAVVSTTPYPGVRLAPAGAPLAQRSEVVSLYKKIVPALGGNGDLVIADTPPISEDNDVRLLVSSLDGVVLLVPAGSTSPADVRALVDSLAGLDTRILGVVLTFSGRAPRVAGAAGWSDRSALRPAPAPVAGAAPPSR